MWYMVSPCVSTRCFQQIFAVERARISGQSPVLSYCVLHNYHITIGDEHKNIDNATDKHVPILFTVNFISFNNNYNMSDRFHKCTSKVDCIQHNGITNKVCNEFLFYCSRRYESVHLKEPAINGDASKDNNKCQYCYAFMF